MFEVLYWQFFLKSTHVVLFLLCCVDYYSLGSYGRCCDFGLPLQMFRAVQTNGISSVFRLIRASMGIMLLLFQQVEAEEWKHS